MEKYLDYSGLSYFWNKIKSWVRNYTHASYDLTTGRTTVVVDNITFDVSHKLPANYAPSTLENDALNPAANDSYDLAFSKIHKAMKDTEKVTAEALTDLDSRIPTKTSLITNDSGYITLSQVPEGAAASATTPLMDGEAAVGTESAFARGDHRHPSDTSKQDVLQWYKEVTGDNTYGELIVKHDTDDIILDLGTNTSTGTTGLAQTFITSTGPYATVGLSTVIKDSNTSGYGIVNNEIRLDHNGVNINTSNGNKAFYNGSELATKADIPDGIEAITGAASTIVSNNLTANRALISNGSGKVVVSEVTSTELGYLDGVTSNVQTQLNNKADNSTAVTNVAYDSTTKKITKTINGITTDVVKVATLGDDGKVPTSQLPSYVDDVIEVYKSNATTSDLSSTYFSSSSTERDPIEPDRGKIYVLMENIMQGTDILHSVNSQYRYTGGTSGTYVQLFDGGISSITTDEIDTVTNESE